MAVTEKRINLIEKKMVLHDEQIARVFSDITDIRDSQHDMLLKHGKMLHNLKEYLLVV